MVKTITIERPIWTKNQTVKATVLIEHVCRGSWRISSNDPSTFGLFRIRSNEKDARKCARICLEQHAKSIDGKVIDLTGQGVFNV